ncbi:hypothetical protein O181_004658 [Austropuccinia psidii MF-1]|uniref:CCHC-type domain-containing protein n=1 Tax=Austropuccinia psidii MF-1 TaxID=1389203 RepID=A0A9Q3BGT1_9BASI|nr:hypothetical protein [Austropuccinia psidii MF-1]
MSGSTRSKKAANNDAGPKPLSNEEVYSMLNSLHSEVSSIKLERVSDAAEMQSLHLALSSPPVLSPYHQQLRVAYPAYDLFMQEPYRASDRSNHLQQDGSNFAKWVTGLNRVLCVAFNSENLVNDLPSLLDNCSLQENRAISHFIDVTLPPDFALCISVVPASTMAKEFFDAIKARCCPGNRFQKLQVVRDLLDLLVENSTGQYKPNRTVILSLCKTFAIFKKLGVDGDELEGLLAQATCQPPASLDRVALDQLVTSTILAKGDKKPLSTFVGQVILNTLRRDDKHPQKTLPFVYCVSDLQECLTPLSRPRSPYCAKPSKSMSKVHFPPEHLVDWFWRLCFHCRRSGHWRANCPHTKGFANPNQRLALPGLFQTPCPGTPDCQSQHLSSPPYQRECLLQVKFVEHDAVDCVLIDTAVLGITFCPSLTYLPQENGKAECLNRTLGDMARAMMVQGQMPQAPSIATLYPHGADAVLHITAVHQCGKLEPWAVYCKLRRALMQADTPAKGSLMHIMNTMLLGEVPTEQYFEEENRAIASLPLVKEVKIPNHLVQELSGPHWDHWRTACLTELAQMAKRDVWDVMVKEPGMKTIGHQWLFDLETNTNSGIAKFKA